MQLGFNLPISGPTSAAPSFARIAQQGEAMGYDYLTLTDHVVLPDVSVPGYPYSESGEFMSNTPTERHELLTATAFIAAKTSRIRLVLAVLVVPHRPAVLAAKMLSTVDVLSEGRLVIGIGAGWLKAEFDAVVTTPFAERGAVTDEYLEAFRALWTQEHARFDGHYTKFADLIFLPRPVQQPHPPIWVGGESGPSLRRAARFGDAWYPIGSNKRHLLDTLPRLAAGIARLRKLVAECRARSRQRVGGVSREALRRCGGAGCVRWRTAAVLRQRQRYRRRPARTARSRRHGDRCRGGGPRRNSHNRQHATVQGDDLRADLTMGRGCGLS